MTQTPNRGGPVEPGASRERRAWRTAPDDELVASQKAEPETGIKAFLRKLSMLFSLDPRSGSR